MAETIVHALVLIGALIAGDSFSGPSLDTRSEARSLSLGSAELPASPSDTGPIQWVLEPVASETPVAPHPRAEQLVGTEKATPESSKSDKKERRLERLFFGDNPLEWYLGGLIVLIYAFRRFNTPKLVATSTTKIRFYFSGFSYYLCSLILFVMIANLIHNSPEIVSVLLNGQGAPPIDNLDTDIKNLSAPLLSAIFLTAFLPHSPVLSRVDEAIIAFFRKIGRIPIAAVVLGAQLRRSGVTVPEVSHRLSDHRSVSVRPELEHFIRTKLTGITPDELQFERSDTTEYRMTAMIWLMMEIDSWETNARYRGLFDAVEAERKEIDSKFEKLVSLFGHYRKFKEQCDESDDDALNATLEQIKSNFVEHYDEVKRGTCDLIARAVLSQEFAPGDRRFRIEQIGFTLPRSAFDLDQFLGLTIVFFVVMLTGISLVGSSSMAPQVAKNVMIASMVAIIYGSAVVCAVLPKSKFGFADIQRRHGRPYAGYILSGILAVSAGVMIALTFKTFWHRSFTDALGDLEKNYPWMFMTFTMAVTMAYLADNFVLPRKPNVSARRFVKRILALLGSGASESTRASQLGERLLRSVASLMFDRAKAANLTPPLWVSCMEGTVAAGVLAVMAGEVVYPMLQQTGAGFAISGGEVDKKFVIMTVSASIGFLAGITVPRLRRKVLYEEQREQDQKFPDSGSSVEVKEALGGLYFTNSLQGPEIEFLADASSGHFYPSNSPILEMGEKTDAVYIVLSGTVKAESVQSSGKKINIGTFDSGDSFGEISLMSGERILANVTALSNCELIKISTSDWKSLFHMHPEAMNKIAEALATRKASQETLSVMSPKKPLDQNIRDYQDKIIASMQATFEVPIPAEDGRARPNLHVAS